jgi:BirA family transcriptional regulator, biotin operon repressor / biotin---[acetyl-CoA-carboxylase] ligase
VLGTPHLHLDVTASTNDRARELALQGAPHGALVTTSEQTAGRGRQGRRWSAPAGTALLMSLILHDAPDLLPLRAAVAVACACGPDALIKWPNDVLIDDRKVAGILAESRPAEGWAVLGIGVNVAVDVADLPPELHAAAGTLGRPRRAIGLFLADLLAALERELAADAIAVLDDWRSRDALLGREVAWNEGVGMARGIDAVGRLVVEHADGTRTALNAGEVHFAGG